MGTCPVVVNPADPALERLQRWLHTTFGGHRDATPPLLENAVTLSAKRLLLSQAAAPETAVPT